jgi:hypothetical protein
MHGMNVKSLQCYIVLFIYFIEVLLLLKIIPGHIDTFVPSGYYFKF